MITEKMIRFRIGGCVCLECYIDPQGNQICVPCGAENI